MRAAAILLVMLTLALPAAARIDPGAAGRFAVGVTTLTVTDVGRARTLVTEVWYPATTAGREAAAHRGRFPLVLVAHGFCGSRTNYEYLTTHLASWGFLVAAPDFPGFTQTVCDQGQARGLIVEPRDDLVFLRAAFHDPASGAARFVTTVRGERAGLVGHSLGGLAVLNAALADAAFSAVVALAPAAGAAQGQMFVGLHPRRAVLAAGGTADDLVRFDDNTLPLFNALPAPAFLLRIVGGTHSGFSDEDSRLSPAQLARQEALTARYATVLLKRYLVGSRPFGRFLTARAAIALGPDVSVTARPR